MNGKSKCKILKDIRRQIARDNDIEYVTAECRHKGDCAGTCPKCEAEVRYLEEELRKRQAAGKAIAVAGIAAALIITTSACELDSVFKSSTTNGEILPSQTDCTEIELMGDMAPPLPEPTIEDIPGGIAE